MSPNHGRSDRMVPRITVCVAWIMEDRRSHTPLPPQGTSLRIGVGVTHAWQFLQYSWMLQANWLIFTNHVVRLLADFSSSLSLPTHICFGSLRRWGASCDNIFIAHVSQWWFCSNLARGASSKGPDPSVVVHATGR